MFIYMVQSSPEECSWGIFLTNNFVRTLFSQFPPQPFFLSVSELANQSQRELWTFTSFLFAALVRSYLCSPFLVTASVVGNLSEKHKKQAQ